MTQDSWKARLVSTHSQDHAVGSEGPGKFLSMHSLNWKEIQEADLSLLRVNGEVHGKAHSDTCDVQCENSCSSRRISTTVQEESYGWSYGNPDH